MYSKSFIDKRIKYIFDNNSDISESSFDNWDKITDKDITNSNYCIQCNKMKDLLLKWKVKYYPDENIYKSKLGCLNFTVSQIDYMVQNEGYDNYNSIIEKDLSINEILSNLN